MKRKYSVTKLRHNLGRYIVPPDCKATKAIDIGCNNGSFIEKYKGFFSEIHAFEPNVYLYKLLEKKYKSYNNIFIHNKAFGKVSGNKVTLCMFDGNDEDGSFAIHRDYLSQWNKANSICEVETISLEDILTLTGPVGYVKSDCECSEYDGFLKKNLEDIPYISMELHVQLGEQKTKELYDFIMKTHTSNHPYVYTPTNREYLFTKK